MQNDNQKQTINLNEKYVINDMNIKYLKIKLFVYNKDALDFINMFNEVHTLKKFYLESKYQLEEEEDEEKLHLSEDNSKISENSEIKTLDYFPQHRLIFIW